MQNGLLIGLSRQVALERELAVVANNIANINTTGFKSDGALFEEYVSKTARSGKLSLRDSKVSFVRDRATWIDMSQGAMQRTGNPTDIAIDGKGFLAIQTPRGERYTRNGALQINEQGLLVTSDGNPVLGDKGPIKFQPKDRNIRISPDGTISVQEGEKVDTEAKRGKLRMVKIENPGALQKDGGSSFALPEGVVPDPDTASHFVQGSVEKSNVRAVIEMTRMIDVTRTYTQVANILAQQGDMQRSAIEKLSEVPN
jgi:flagellar basal-body rod protein FlgF